MKHKAFVVSTACLLVVLLSGGGCKLFQKKEPIVPLPPEITVSPTNPAKQVFTDKTFGISFEYPSTWVYNSSPASEDMLSGEFSDAKDSGTIIMNIIAPPYDDRPLYGSKEVETKKYTPGGGSIEYRLYRPCLNQDEMENDNSCKVAQRGGFVVANWLKGNKPVSPNLENIEMTGELSMNFPEKLSATEEKKWLEDFNQVVKSFKFIDNSASELTVVGQYEFFVNQAPSGFTSSALDKICFTPAQKETVNDGAMFCFTNELSALSEFGFKESALDKTCKKYWGVAQIKIKDLVRASKVLKSDSCFNKGTCKISEATLVQVAKLETKPQCEK